MAASANVVEFFRGFLFFWGFLGLVACTYALWWYFRAGRTHYVCDGQTLKAIRSGRVLRVVECSDIKSIEFVGSMTWGGLFFVSSPPPDTLWLRVGLTRPVRWAAFESFPPLLIWGNQAADDARDALAAAAGLRVTATTE